MQSQCTAVKSFKAEQLACRIKNIINGCFPDSCTNGPGIRARILTVHSTVVTKNISYSLCLKSCRLPSMLSVAVIKHT